MHTMVHENIKTSWNVHLRRHPISVFIALSRHVTFYPDSKRLQRARGASKSHGVA